MIESINTVDPESQNDEPRPATYGPERLADELEYRVRTAAALAKGGRSIDAEVKAGRERIMALADGYRRILALADRDPRTPAPAAPAAVEAAAQVIDGVWCDEYFSRFDHDPDDENIVLAEALADAGLLRGVVTDAMVDAAVETHWPGMLSMPDKLWARNTNVPASQREQFTQDCRAVARAMLTAALGGGS